MPFAYIYICFRHIKLRRFLPRPISTRLLPARQSSLLEMERVVEKRRLPTRLFFSLCTAPLVVDQTSTI